MLTIVNADNEIDSGLNLVNDGSGVPDKPDRIELTMKKLVKSSALMT